jgi:hypothetical protein
MQKCTYILSFDNKYNSDNSSSFLPFSMNYSSKRKNMLYTIYNEILVLHARHRKIKANMYWADGASTLSSHILSTNLLCIRSILLLKSKVA